MARAGAAPERLVLRRDPPGHVIESSRRLEFELLRAAEAAGVPVPRVRWCGENELDLLQEAPAEPVASDGDPETEGSGDE